MPLQSIFRTLKAAMTGRYVPMRDLESRVRDIRLHEAQFQNLESAELMTSFAQFKLRFDHGETLEALLPECFAAVQNAIKRAMDIEIRDVQLVGAMAMHHGSIVEMATGEGKSLMVLFPAFLQSLSGEGVHIATLNPYLAERDHAQAERVLGLLGCSVGLLSPRTKPVTRRQAYACHITYSVYDEFARDYLRDNTQLTSSDLVQRGHASVFLDEIDAILIDEARVPVTLTETHEPSDTLYRGVQHIIANLAPDLIEIDEESNSVHLTEAGQDEVEEGLRSSGQLTLSDSIYDPHNIDLAHTVLKALQANFAFARDKDYVVLNEQVVLVDPVTGRAMPGRRFGDGLHQALEAKEGVPLGPETQILSTITVQNYFRVYTKRAGMTATAIENAHEFKEVYNLEVVQLPPANALIRQDMPDEFFETSSKKYDAVIARITEANRKKQPVLVGTTSIRQSEDISQRLNALSIEHQLLTARHDADEAQVIANAGLPGVITIAANMAGRGTDIYLGGPHPSGKADNVDTKAHRIRRQEVLDAGGLLVIGTEKHDSRRLDKQLRGRAGRQGDPGMSVFILSLEDDFIRPILKKKRDYFKGRKTDSRFGQQWIRSFFSSHQRNIEESHSQLRIQLMKFDTVLHKQRQVVFAERLRLMKDADLHSVVAAMRNQVIDDVIDRHISGRNAIDTIATELFCRECEELFGISSSDLDDLILSFSSGPLNETEIRNVLRHYADNLSARRRTQFGPDLSASFERQAVLNAIDLRWNEHQRVMERLRSVIGLRAEGRRDPYSEYQTEAFDLFEKMLTQLRFDVTRSLARARPLDTQQQIKIIEGLLFNANASQPM